MIRRKSFFKKSGSKLYRLSQGRALRLKRIKQRRARILSRHSLQFVVQEI